MLARILAVVLFCIGLFALSHAQMAPNVSAVVLDSQFKKASGGGVTGWCSLIPQTNLTNCWPFDTTYTTTSVATDPIGGANLALSNITLNGSGPSANLNNAINCNGTTSSGSASGSTGSTMLSSASWSLVMWINSTGVSGNRPMANDHTDADNKGFQVIVTGGSLVTGLDVGNNTTQIQTNTNSFSASTWTMLTWTYSGTTVTPYVNTTAGTTGTITGPVVAGTNGVAACFNPAYSGDFYNGKLAGVAHYNGTALSAGQVTTINGL